MKHLDESVRSVPYPVFSKIHHLLAKVRDIFFADVTYVLPSALKWLYQTKISHQIYSFKIQKTINNKTKTAILYLHGDLRLTANKETSVVLLLHGLHGHPYTLLHLANIAQKTALGPVFSLYLRYNNHDPEIHRFLLKQAIDTIENLLQKNGGTLKDVVATGHSLGATESAYRAFVEKDTRIRAVISIAGRLKLDPSLDTPSRIHQKASIESLYRGIQQYPNLLLYQIAGSHDWCLPLETTVVRPNVDCSHIVQKAMHLNVLYHHETRSKFAEFLSKSLR